MAKHNATVITTDVLQWALSAYHVYILPHVCIGLLGSESRIQLEKAMQNMGTARTKLGYRGLASCSRPGQRINAKKKNWYLKKKKKNVPILWN